MFQHGEEPLAALMDVGSLMIRADFIVKGDSKVLETLHYLSWLTVDGNVAMTNTGFIAGFSEEHVSIGEIQEDVALCAPVKRDMEC